MKHQPYHPFALSRRQFVTGVTGGVFLSTALRPRELFALPTSPTGPSILQGNNFNLTIGYQEVNFTGKKILATSINGSIPAPTLRWREGDTVTLRVKNTLAEDSSIHWHGIILPSEMDGVPHLSFHGIKPGETFEYRFQVNQHGTYWYHSHSGFQEQTGVYGSIIIDPKESEPFSYDRDYVVMLSDWSDTNPHEIYSNLKKLSEYYNFNARTAADSWRDIKEKGVKQTWNERSMWNQMRMSDRDISDITGYTYIFLMNGQTPDSGWLGLFKPNEKVRLRFINGAGMTIFDVRIPGLKMKVVAADGQAIDPISVDDFRIGVAETYDVIVEPLSDSAYTLFAQAIDRTGYARGTLTADPSLQSEIPAMDPRPVLSHGDMGMDHSTMNMDHDMSGMKGMGHSMHLGMNMGESKMGSGRAGFGSDKPITHAPTEFGPHVDMRVDTPQYRLDDPGIGLREHKQKYGRRVLTYADLCNYYPTSDLREPGREIELHLTGNMSRYMWSINGLKFTEAEPIQLTYGERVRFTLVNDTMMNHPIHLHGMWSELETGDAKYIPRKHTVIVQPGSKISYLVTADAKGRWAYHCHLLFHMLSMSREVRVS